MSLQIHRPGSGGGSSGPTAIGDITGLQTALDDKALQRQWITATPSATQTQGNGAVTFDAGVENVVVHITTVITSGDAVTLDDVAEGIDLLVLNDGANPITLWPASGDDLGAGVDTSVTVAAGGTLARVGKDATSWGAWIPAGGVQYASGGGTSGRIQYSDGSGNLANAPIAVGAVASNILTLTSTSSYASIYSSERFWMGGYGTLNLALMTDYSYFSGGVAIGLAASPARALEVRDDSGSDQQQWSYSDTAYARRRVDADGYTYDVLSGSRHFIQNPAGDWVRFIPAATFGQIATSSPQMSLASGNAARMYVGATIDCLYELIAESNFRIETPTVPASAAATGPAGRISWDADYIYVCTATNTWKRAALTTW